MLFDAKMSGIEFVHKKWRVCFYVIFVINYVKDISNVENYFIVINCWSFF